MIGRALVIRILCGLVGFVWLPLRVDAQSLDDEEDMSTGEISEEVSDTHSVSDDSTSDGHLSDESPSENTGNRGIPRPQTPLQPNR